MATASVKITTCYQGGVELKFLGASMKSIAPQGPVDVTETFAPFLRGERGLQGPQGEKGEIGFPVWEGLKHLERK